MQYTLRELRARNKESQTEAAKYVGVGLTTYNGWENGKLEKAKFGEVLKLAEHFGVSIAEIKV